MKPLMAFADRPDPSRTQWETTHWLNSQIVVPFSMEAGVKALSVSPACPNRQHLFRPVLGRDADSGTDEQPGEAPLLEVEERTIEHYRLDRQLPSPCGPQR